MKIYKLETYMVNFSKKLISLLVTVLAVAGMFIVNAGAFDAKERVACFTENNTEVVCIAHRGDWHSYPENSAEAVKAAAEYGVVSVDIKLTSDGQPVLMADETISRMCACSDGKPVSGDVKSFTLSELKELRLRGGNGSDRNVVTDFIPASLEDAAEAAGTNVALMLNLSCSDFKAVYEKVKELNISDRVIFRFSDSNKKILETVKGISDINVCGNYQGNIIFLATGAIKNSFANGINTVELGSANGHGVLYDNFLMKRFDSRGKAMVSMVNGRCGKRADSEIGWDDLISRGYSIIETDYPKELSEYIEKSGNAKTELERYLSLYEDTDLSPYTTDTETAFNNAVSQAKAVLKKSSSLSDIENARYSLQSAADKLTVGAKKAVTLSFKITPGRIAAVVLCGAAVLVSQILLYKRREKKD